MRDCTNTSSLSCWSSWFDRLTCWCLLNAYRPFYLFTPTATNLPELFLHIAEVGLDLFTPRVTLHSTNFHAGDRRPILMYDDISSIFYKANLYTWKMCCL